MQCCDTKLSTKHKADHTEQFASLKVSIRKTQYPSHFSSFVRWPGAAYASTAMLENFRAPIRSLKRISISSNDLPFDSGSLKNAQIKKSAQVLPQKNPALPFQFASVGFTM